MDSRRTWEWASAVIVKLNGDLEFRSGFFGLITMRQINPPAEECRVRYLCVADYWSSYR